MTEKLELSKPTLDLIRVARDIAERDLKLGLVTEEQMRYTIRARKEVVKELKYQGMSNREIAGEVGVSETTIRSDLGTKLDKRSAGKPRNNAGKPRIEKKGIPTPEDCDYDPEMDMQEDSTRKRGILWMAKESAQYAEKVNDYCLDKSSVVDETVFAAVLNAAEAWEAALQVAKRRNIRMIKNA